MHIFLSSFYSFMYGTRDQALRGRPRRRGDVGKESASTTGVGATLAGDLAGRPRFLGLTVIASLVAGVFCTNRRHVGESVSGKEGYNWEYYVLNNSKIFVCDNRRHGK